MTPDELQNVLETERDRQSRLKHRINVCMAASCMSRHSERIADDNIKSQFFLDFSFKPSNHTFTKIYMSTR